MKRIAATVLLIAAAVSLCSCWRFYNYEEKREYGPTAEFISYNERYIYNPEKNAVLPTTFNVKKPKESDGVPAYRKSDYTGDSEYALEAAKLVTVESGGSSYLSLFRRYGDTELFVFRVNETPPDGWDDVCRYDVVTVKDGEARLTGSVGNVVPTYYGVGFAHAYEDGKFYMMPKAGENSYYLAVVDFEKNRLELNEVKSNTVDVPAELSAVAPAETGRAGATLESKEAPAEYVYEESGVDNICVRNGKVYYIFKSYGADYSPVVEYDPAAGTAKKVSQIGNRFYSQKLAATEDGFVIYARETVNEDDKTVFNAFLTFTDAAFEKQREIRLSKQKTGYGYDETVLAWKNKVYIVTGYNYAIVYDSEKNTEKVIDCSYAGFDTCALVEKRDGKIRHLD